MTFDEEAPRGIVQLIRQLEADGFEIARMRGSGPVNRVIELARGPLEIHITEDRGQWWIELGFPAVTGTYDSSIWKACLDESMVNMEPDSLDEQIDFVRLRWREVDQTGQEDSDVARCLYELRSARARRRLGL